MRPLKAHYGHTIAREFGPLALRAVREKMIADGLAQTNINGRIAIIRRLFKWAVSMEMTPPSVWEGLRSVQGLQAGRSAARESEPVASVPVADVEAVLPFLRPPIRAMVKLQRLTGMRSGEVLSMRLGEIDTSGSIWYSSPGSHKTAYRGKARTICLGPQAQLVLKPFLNGLSADDFICSPERDQRDRTAERRAKRGTPLWPSHLRLQADKRAPKRKRTPGRRYGRQSYTTAIYRACDRAKVGRWHPHQLRHLHATEVRHVFGLEAAQVALGHSKADVTQVYAERDLKLAERVARQVG
jgi:integrase